MERFRKWLARLLWPGIDKEVEALNGRLATCHRRMQEMYWDEKAKELAKSRIAWLEERLAAAYEHLCPPRSHDHWTCEEYVEKVLAEKAAKADPEPPSDAEIDAPRGDVPEGLVFDHPGRHGSWASLEEAPRVLKCAALGAPDCGDPRCPIHGLKGGHA